MCFLSCLHVISFRRPRSFKLGFQKLAAVPGRYPQAWPRQLPPGAGEAPPSAPTSSSSDGKAPRYCVYGFLGLWSTPKLHPWLLCQVQYSFLSSFLFLLTPHQEYPIAFINTCFKNITVSCCFKFRRAIQDFRVLQMSQAVHILSTKCAFLVNPKYNSSEETFSCTQFFFFS